MSTRAALLVYKRFPFCLNNDCAMQIHKAVSITYGKSTGSGIIGFFEFGKSIVDCLSSTSNLGNWLEKYEFVVMYKWKPLLKVLYSYNVYGSPFRYMMLDFITADFFLVWWKNNHLCICSSSLWFGQMARIHAYNFFNSLRCIQFINTWAFYPNASKAQDFIRNYLIADIRGLLLTFAKNFSREGKINTSGITCKSIA